MTGRPQMPGYLGKHERFVLELPFAQVGRGFPNPKATLVPEDDFAPDVSYLTPEMLRAFYEHDVAQAARDAIAKRGLRNAQPQHLRIVPMRRGLRFELVVKIPNPYPEGSFLHNLVQEHAGVLAGLTDEHEREHWLMGHLGGLSADALPRIAGIDLGRCNLASVAYSTGHKAAVHTGGRFTAGMEDFARRIGKRVALATPARANELQGCKKALQDEGEKLPRHEDIELRTLLKAVYEDDEYRRLVDKQKRWSQDYLHKLSTAIVEDCAERKIGVVVIGRNKLWKQESGMGTEENRKFHQVAHATLIRLVTYKAESCGITVVTTEESYTSKTSFVNGDDLQCYTEKTKAGEAPDQATRSTPVVLTGKRSSADRNWFRHKNRDDRWEWVHADVNGAFNIIRKVFTRFAYHADLTLKFNLFRVSPWKGVSPLALAHVGV